MGQYQVICTGKAIISGSHMYKIDLLQSINVAKVKYHCHFIGSAKQL